MRIKPLIWFKHDSGEHYVSKTQWRCNYHINKPIKGYGEGQYMATFCDYANDPWHHLSNTAQEAMDACDKHHVAKVMSLVEVSDGRG